MAHWTKVLVGTKAELEARTIERNRLCFAEDEGRWYRTEDEGPGADVLNLLGESEEDYAGEGSFQAAGADLSLDPDAGSADGADPSFIAAAMFNIIGADLTAGQDANYLAGVIGAYNITGTKRTSYPAGGVLGLIGDGVTEADGCFVAVIDGDSAQTNAEAAFKVMCNNSTAASGVDYGLDLQDAAHDGYIAVNEAFYKKAFIRFPNDIVFMSGAGAPVDGTTGDNFAGPGSLYIDRTNKDWYIQDGADKENPTWEKITD